MFQETSYYTTLSLTIFLFHPQPQPHLYHKNLSQSIQSIHLLTLIMKFTLAATLVAFVALVSAAPAPAEYQKGAEAAAIKRAEYKGQCHGCVD